MNIPKVKVLFLFQIMIFTSCLDQDLVEPSNTAQSNFELLWQLVDENYCYFSHKNVNWDSVKTIYEDRVRNDMKEEELFSVCSSMLNELKDGHVNLYSDFNTSRYWKWFTDYPPNYDENITRTYLGEDFLYAGPVKAKKLNTIGYITYTSFMNEVSSANIYSVIEKLGAVEGLVIDVRNNGGGRLDLVDTLISCFTPEKKHIGYIKYKEGPGHDQFSSYFRQHVEGREPVAFDKEIVVLTNRMVYSAANYFVSGMNELPNVTLIGDRTGGGGGAPFSSELPNGWSVRFSKNPLLSVNKEHIEHGISPDYKVDMLQADESKNIDTILEEAVFYLSGTYYKK